MKNIRKNYPVFTWTGRLLIWLYLCMESATESGERRVEEVLPFIALGVLTGVFIPLLIAISLIAGACPPFLGFFVGGVSLFCYLLLGISLYFMSPISNVPTVWHCRGSW